jgi:hypothetical protein
MTRGASVSASRRERTGVSGPTWRCWPERRGAGSARESERSAGAHGPRARQAGPSERGRREAAHVEILFFFFKNVK